MEFSQAKKKYFWFGMHKNLLPSTLLYIIEFINCIICNFVLGTQTLMKRVNKTGVDFLSTTKIILDRYQEYINDKPSHIGISQ